MQRYRHKDRKQVKAYLQMLKDCNQVQTAKTFKEMSEKTNNATAQNATANGTENATANGVQATENTAFSFAKSFNKTTFDVDVTDFEYCKLAALYNADAPQTVYRVNAMWVQKSPLGDSPVFVVSELGKLVNMPSHTAATVREITANAAAVDAIKNGKVGFTVYEYESHGKKCYNVRFVDL
ncbi:MAG: hypothetical protein IIW86_04170 [Clostridia bacterium]|nr:hypothetical protein [Clostridia bacterium]